MRRMKMVLVGVGSAALLATGGTLSVGVASPGAATTDPKGASAGSVSAKTYDCTRGAACFYTGTGGSGTRHERFANSDVNIYGINSAVNNGFTSETLDHVKVKWNWTGSSTSYWGCLSPGETWNVGDSFTVDAIRWVDSC